jgi:general secretion pathway protein G
MKEDLIKRRSLSQEAGFTLIELLMVVIILGILAAVVIPQFSGSTEDAKVSALKSNLSSIRSAVELYQVQHNGQYPTAGDPNIDTQLTKYTDLTGAVSPTKDDAHKYGPYLKQGFPKNPFAVNSDLADQIAIEASTTVEIGTVKADDPSTATTGWKYVVKTGEFIANTKAYEKY